MFLSYLDDLILLSYNHQFLFIIVFKRRIKEDFRHANYIKIILYNHTLIMTGFVEIVSCS